MRLCLKGCSPRWELFIGIKANEIEPVPEEQLSCKMNDNMPIYPEIIWQCNLGIFNLNTKVPWTVICPRVYVKFISQ